MSNILTGIIKILAPGADVTFKKVEVGVKNLDGSLNKLQTNVAAFGGGVKNFTANNNLLSSGLVTTKKNVDGAKSSFSNLGKQLVSSRVLMLGAATAVALIGKAIIDAFTGIESAASRMDKAQFKAIETTQKEVVQLGLLNDIAKDVSLTYGQRQKAIDEINKKYPEFLGRINQENILYGETQDAINGVINALVKKAQITELVSQVAELNNQVESLTRQQQKAGFEFQSTFTGAINKSKELSKALYEQAKALQAATNPALSYAGSAFNKIFGNSGDIFGGASGGIKVPSIKIKPDKVLLDLKNIKIAEQGPILLPPDEIKVQGLEFGQLFFPEIKKIADSQEPYDLTVDFAIKDLEKEKQRLDELYQVGLAIGDVFSQAFDGLFDSISNGTNAIEGFFKGMVNGIKQVIAQLIQAAAVAGILSLLGFGSFGGLFKGILGIAGKRAAGGPVTGGQTYLVGEKGPELFTPSTGGGITPNHQLGGRGSSVSGGMMVNVSGQFLARGQDLLAVIALANQSNNRLGG